MSRRQLIVLNLAERANEPKQIVRSLGWMSLGKTRFLSSYAHHYQISLFLMAARAIVHVYLTSNKSRPCAEREKEWAGKKGGKDTNALRRVAAFGPSVPFARTAVFPSSSPSPQQWREANETGAPRVIESGL